MEEYWKPVEGYEGLYEVSDLGRVRSKRGILSPAIDPNGYLRVSLSNDGKQKTFKVHRLVATAFVPNMFNLEQVNHINENKTDNRAENLMWCDNRENSSWGSRGKRISEANTNGKLSKPVLQFSKTGEFIREWPSAMEVERVLGFQHSHIVNCCNGKRKTHQGYIWRYK